MEREGVLMNKSYLEIKNVSFSYKNKEVLKNISFTVKKGESISIFGPNGSGKTTLLKVILGILKPQKGGVYFNGIDIFKISERERGKIFSYVPQKVNIFFPLKTFDYLLTGRAPYIDGFVKKEDKEIVLYWMEKFNITHLKDINFQILSEGEKQLLTLIRTLIQETEIIILDEPLTHLDLKFKIKILNLLKELKSSQKTIISVFHEINSIKYLCDKIILLKNGVLEKYGEVKNLVKIEEIINLFEENIPFIF
ncbi:MAG: ABC transporter ATP-binding protein [Caldisericia bacterium]|jgi:iron complex transport system ATP-binding protein|nr:ABC transporter ATP-binding protein [Caldisericia bacterium]